MSKRTLLNLTLLAIIVTLGLLAWFKPGIKTAPVEPPLVTLQAADIHDIQIQRHGSDEVSLRRQGSSWRMTKPREIAADDFLIKATLDNLAAPTISHFKVVAADLARYGLADPQLRLRLNDTEIDFGNTEPLQGHRYVRVGATIFLAAGGLFYRLSHDPLWWVDKQLLPPDAHITALQLPDATLTLKDGKWQLTPADPAVSADAIQKLVDTWHDARAMDVLAPKTGKSAGKPDGEVAIQLAGQTGPLRFEILDNPDFLLLVRPDLKLEYRFENAERDSLLHLQATTPKQPATGHNGAKERPDARAAGSRDHPPGH
ncbi:MAG TPA: DUF4340 domain-containing protein [Gammaproteobacteria bacterium]|nr:DUF4340 domain-containing protein [Gammaproteobacteria bacterium]